MIEDVGSRIREIRKEKGLTLMELAKTTGLSAAYLSNLERDMCSPTLENVQRICAALNIEIIKLLDDSGWKNQEVIHAENRDVIFEQKGQIRYEAINFGPGRMDGVYIVIEPHCEYKKNWTHSRDEIGYILDGELTISIDERSYVLKAGDAFYIDAMKKHNLNNFSDKPCISLWIKQASEPGN